MRTSFSVNDMTIHRIVEQEAGFTPMLDFLPTLSKETHGENLSWLAPGGYDSASGNVVLCFQSYIVKTPHHNILVDSCIGNDKNFPNRPAWNKKTDPNWMKALKAAGLGVEDIDFVMCTHLHADHVGWNTRLENGRWVPTFPRARYVMARKEFEHFNRMHEAKPELPVSRGAFADSVLPVVEHGRAVFVGPDHVIAGEAGRGVWLSPTNGHTPGHVAVRVQDGGPLAILSGDAIHHPIQFAEHDLYNPADVDRAAARKT